MNVSGRYKENFPGFADVIQGPWLMEQMQKQAEHVGTEMFFDVITEVDLSERPFQAKGDSGDTYSGDTIVIATGAQARWLGLPSEKEFGGFGVSACATCDGFFFRGKEICVIGGGNSAVEEALYLTNHAEKVTVIHRRDHFRAEKILQNRLFGNPKIEVIWESVVEEILGEQGPPKGVTGVRIKNMKTGEIRDLKVDGVFVAIGHDPATSLIRGQIDLDESGYIEIAPWSTATSVPGAFACGDVADARFRQAVTAAGMGCMAALEAEKFLAEHSADPTIRARESNKDDMIGAWR